MFLFRQMPLILQTPNSDQDCKCINCACSNTQKNNQRTRLSSCWKYPFWDTKVVHRISEPSKLFNSNRTSPVLQNLDTHFWFTYTSHSELQVKISMDRLSLLLSIFIRGDIRCDTCRTQGNDKIDALYNKFIYILHSYSVNALTFSTNKSLHCEQFSQNLHFS